MIFWELIMSTIEVSRLFLENFILVFGILANIVHERNLRLTAIFWPDLRTNV